MPLVNDYKIQSCSQQKTENISQRKKTMETTYNNLSPYAQQFFANLRTYLDRPLYFFGSVQRPDYFMGSSDIDVDIFCEVPTSTILQLQNFLHVDASEFKKMVWKISTSGRLVSGHKLMYKDPEHGLIVEFSIYNEKYMDDVLADHRHKMVLPFYVTIFLIILKFFYYGLGILPKEYYNNVKRFILNTLVNQGDEDFIVVDMKQPKPSTIPKK